MPWPQSPSGDRSDTGTSVWVVTRALDSPNPHGQPVAFLSYTGFLAGIVLAYPLEARFVGFDPRSSTVLRKAARFALSIALVMGTPVLLDGASASIADDASPAGNVLRYLRYAAAGVAGMLLGSYLFVRLGLAEGREQGPDCPH